MSSKMKQQCLLLKQSKAQIQTRGEIKEPTTFSCFIDRHVCMYICKTEGYRKFTKKNPYI